METTILEQCQHTQRLVRILQDYADNLERHVAVYPKQELEEAVRRGFPVDIYNTYLAHLCARETEAKMIVAYIKGVCVPLLEYVAGKLNDALSRHGNVSSRVLSVSDFPGFGATDSMLRNNRDIEKALGLTQGKRMSIEEADKQNSNPNYYKSHQYRVNCATCTAAYVLRLRGFDVKAKGNPEKNDNLNTWLSECHSFDIWNNVDGTPATPIYTQEWMRNNGIVSMSSQDYIRFLEETCKERGVYVFTLAWKGRGAHATILQRDADGQLYYIEPQLYESAKGEDGRRRLDELVNDLAPVQPPEKGVMRVDNKLFNVKYAQLFTT